MNKPASNYIADQDSLRRLCQQLLGTKRLALDTEFVGENSFVPRLELLQIATEECCAAIDVPAVESLDALIPSLTDVSVEKVVHAGRQDLELLHTHLGRLPAPIFDTQLAAAMVGYGTQVGYAPLVQRVLGNTLHKEHTLTNWSQRPLTTEQVEYALEDVRFLLPLHTHLAHRLTTLGRLDWVREEFSNLAARPAHESNDPRRRYERIKGWDSLRPRAAAVLRELAAWREEEARRRNVPRGRVVRDDILLELARRAPNSADALRSMRGCSPSLVDRYGERLIELIAMGSAVPASQLPDIRRTPKPDPDTAGRTDLLQAVLKACAHKASIAPTLLATTSDLQALVEAKGGLEKLEVPILKGWRRQIAGETLLRVLAGKIQVSLDPPTGALELSDRDHGSSR